MIKTYSHANDYFADNKNILLTNQVHANLIWTNAKSGKSTDEGFFGMKAWNNSSIFLVIRCTPWPMVCFSIGDNIKDLAIEIFYKMDNSYFPERINGTKDAVTTFAKITNENGINYIKNLELYTMKLEKVQDVKITDGKFICAKNYEFDAADWTQNFHIDCGLGELENPSQQTKSLIESGNLYYYVVDDKVVTMGAKNRETPNGGCVGWVYTPDDLRNNGYSSACIKNLSQKILDDGKDFAFLYADKANPVSCHVYRKLGYKEVGEFCEFKKEK